jgi:hypothetical protein
MPNPDGSLNWNDPGFISTLQAYQNAGGDMNRAAEFLYTGAGRTDPTQDGSTIERRIANMDAEPSDWQIQQAMNRDQGFASSQLNSSAYNPRGANAYLISNSVGLNSGYAPKLNWGIGKTVPKSTWTTGGIVPGSMADTQANKQAAVAAGNLASVNTGTYTGTPAPANRLPGDGSGNNNNNTITSAAQNNNNTNTNNQTRNNNNNNANTGNNQAETLQSNSIDLNKNRQGLFKRSAAGGYSNGAQYFQSASLPGGGANGVSGYGGLGYSSANSGSGWGGGNNWNRAIWR